MTSEPLLDQPLQRRALLAVTLALLPPAAQASTPPRSSGARPGAVPIGQALPDTPLLGLNGPGRRLAEYRGRPLIINVWASWCGPCRAEMASLERLAWSDTARRFAIIGVSTDDHAAAARAYLQRSNATISHFLDHGLVIERLLGATHLPLTVLVDAQGRIVEKVVGAREWDGPDAVRLIRKAFPTTGGTPRR